MKPVLFICLIFIFISCRTETKTTVLAPAKMEAVLLDFVMAEAYTNTRFPVDSVIISKKENIKLQKKIFAVHGITKEQFEYSFDYYTKHANEFTTILDSIAAKENRRNVEPIKVNKYE